MASLDCCVLTFNCARQQVDSAYFARALHDALSPSSSDPPDLLVLALQELAPIAYSFLGGAHLNAYFSRFEDAIDALTDLWTGTTIRYELLQTLNAGMTGIMVFAQPDVARTLSEIETGEVRVGDYELGNKGAVGVRMSYMPGTTAAGEGRVLTFVSAHLAPYEESWRRRNEDWGVIASNMVFTPTRSSSSSRRRREGGGGGGGGNHDDNNNNNSTTETEPLLFASPSVLDRSLHAPISTLFVAGDLNYRASDLKPHPDAHRAWSAPSRGQSDPQDPSSPFAELFKTDQLSRERAASRTLHGLEEETVRFAPTYKYSEAGVAALLLSSSSSTSSSSQAGNNKKKKKLVPSDSSSVWAKHRTPSWCDRVLYRPGTRAGVKVTSYTALGVQPSSDHSPVLFRCEIGKEQHVGHHQSSPPGVVRAAAAEVDPGWEARRARSARRDFVVGVGAYLSTTMEGALLMAGLLAAGLGAAAVARSLGM